MNVFTNKLALLILPILIITNSAASKTIKSQTAAGRGKLHEIRRVSIIQSYHERRWLCRFSSIDNKQ